MKMKSCALLVCLSFSVVCSASSANGHRSERLVTESAAGKQRVEAHAVAQIGRRAKSQPAPEGAIPAADEIAAHESRVAAMAELLRALREERERGTGQ